MCGVVGVISESLPLELAKNALLDLYKRGQDATGITWTWDRLLDGDKCWHSACNLQRTEGMFNACVGATRYATMGVSPDETSINQFAQPFNVLTNKDFVTLAHNGNIINIPLNNYQSDAVVIAQLLGDQLGKEKYIDIGVKNVMSTLDGAYSVVALINPSTIIAFRDPHGIRPLCYGRLGNGYVVASETHVLDRMNATLEGDVPPGGLLVLKNGELEKYRLFYETPAHCMFEYTYFSQATSTIDGVNVHEARQRLGKTLAEIVEKDIDVSSLDAVVPVPDTSRSAALGASNYLGVPYSTAILKSRDIRTFIQPEQDRARDATLKYSIINSMVRGKNLLLIDDSIVRGTTAGPLIELLKKRGAKKIHFAVTTPRITHPCFYGIDMSTKEELISANKTIEETREELGCDTLNFMDIKGLVDGIGLGSGLCMGCLTGKYPTCHANKLTKLIDDKKLTGGVRSYEEYARIIGG